MRLLAGSSDRHLSRALIGRYRLGLTYLLFAIVGVLGFGIRGTFAVEPYQIRMANPLEQPWRISQYPELSGRGLKCLAEDSAGNMWFGVRDGVVKYDGVHWTDYGAEQGLEGNGVVVLASRDDWLVAVTSGGIFRLVDGHWRKLISTDNEVVDVTFVTITSDKTVWACCSCGLLKWRDGTSTFYTAKKFVQPIEQLALFDSIVALPVHCCPRIGFRKGTGVELLRQRVVLSSEDSPAKAAGLRVGDRVLNVDGIATQLPRGLRRHDGEKLVLEIERKTTAKRETLSFTAANIIGRFRSPGMCSVLEDKSGNVWVGATGGGVLFTADDGKTWRTWTSKDELDVGIRPRIVQIADGDIWVVCNDRKSTIARYDGTTWSHESFGVYGSTGLVSVAQTTDGTVWLGGKNLIRLYRGGKWSAFDTRDYEVPSDMSGMLVASDQSLWIAADDRQPVRFAMSPMECLSVESLEFQCVESSGVEWFIESKTHRLIRFDQMQAVAYGEADGVIDDPDAIVTVPSGGVVTVGSHDGVAGAATFNGETWHREVFPGFAGGLRANGNVMASDGRIWVAGKNKSDSQQGGILVGIGDQWSTFHAVGNPQSATTIIELHDGRIMTGGSYGLYLCDGGKWSRVHDQLLVGAELQDATVDLRGAAWFATRAHGLRRFQHGTWTAITSDDGLLSDEILAVHAVPSGDLLISTGSGWCLYDGNSFFALNLPAGLGRRSVQSGYSDSLWFNGTHRVGRNQAVPVVFLNDGSIDVNQGVEAMVSWRGADAWNETAVDRLGWSYQINDGPWSDFSSQSQVAVRGLPMGTHQVSVRARDQDFNISASAQVASITVHPPLWKRPTFAFLVLGVLGLLTWQAYGLVRRGIYLRRVNQELQTARLQLTDQFAEKSAQFRAICDCSPVGIFVSDMAGQVTYFNRLLERMSGLSNTAARDSGWTDAIHPEDRDRVVGLWEQSARECTQYQTWGRFVRSDGSTINFEVIADPIERDGELVGFVGAVEDVTARIAASVDLEDSNSQLREALEQLKLAQNKAIKQERLNALGQMAAGVAHDINNSLAPLLTYSELLEQDPQVKGEGRHWVEMIRLGVSDTAGIVRRLDHFYRESHNRAFLQPIDVAVVIHQAIELTRPRWQNFSRAEGKQIDVRLQDDAQPMVEGDATQIRAVLTNLIFNAVDAITGRGTVNVCVTETLGHAVITVADDGCGMTADQLDHCLEPFYTSKSKGSGLGLSECHGIVRQHRGSLIVSSELGRGTIVCVKLPLSAPANGNSDGFEDPTIAFNGQGEEATSFSESNDSPQRVLYIDDDENVRQSTVSLLSALGVSVEAFSNGPSGLARLEQSDFSLVLCDQGMPGMDGIAVLAEIKKRWPDMPVVIISGWSLPGLHGGIQPDGFLMKPVALADLVKELGNFLPSLNSA